MQINVNGESRDVATGSTIAGLIDTLGLEQKTVVAQRNDDIIERHAYASTLIHDGDCIELIRFVGGG